MRFLKNKIARAGGHSLLPPSFSPSIKIEQSTSQRVSPVKQEFQESPSGCKRHLSGDNIMKNYGRAMTNFALSTTARYYLVTIATRNDVSLQDFSEYIRRKKKSANCIKQIRRMLPLDEDENDEEFKLKKVFQELCVVFLKFFSVNWLYSSKIAEKVQHLKYRFKILRRVQNPQYFTYLKDFHAGR